MGFAQKDSAHEIKQYHRVLDKTRGVVLDDTDLGQEAGIHIAQARAARNQLDAYAAGEPQQSHHHPDTLRKVVTTARSRLATILLLSRLGKKVK